MLNAFARKVNPHLETIHRAGFGGYYWVTDQGEHATDVLFDKRASLKALFPALVELSMTAFSAEDVLRFLGRKLHGNFKGEVTTDLKRRPEGQRVKHRINRNSLKMYDPANYLRVETTINNPREFRVLRVVQTREGRQRRWMPMGKGVSNLWRYGQVALQANSRYLDALLKPPSAQPFYKHAVTLRLQGSYAQLTDYVARIEAQPWTVRWELARLDARRHPQLELTLKLNTLSREPTWARL